MTQNEKTDNTIILLEHKAYHANFSRLYQYAMALVEESAEYIDAHGREAIRGSSPELADLYTKESIRLTTRLMQLASWLLLFRAGQENEMTQEQIKLEKRKISLHTPSYKGVSKLWDALPEAFRCLVEQSLELERRLQLLEKSPNLEPAKNPVEEQLTRITSGVRKF